MNALLNVFTELSSEPAMDIARIAVFLTALASLLGVLAWLADSVVKLRKQIKGERLNRKIEWHGRVARGFVEAMKYQAIAYECGVWSCTDEARDIYAPVRLQLVRLYETMRDELGKNPSDDEFTWRVESTRELQAWMITHGCPKLGLLHLGCLAVAFVIGQEAAGGYFREIPTDDIQ